MKIAVPQLYRNTVSASLFTEGEAKRHMLQPAAATVASVRSISSPYSRLLVQ
jgi:hypothetical protein